MTAARRLRVLALTASLAVLGGCMPLYLPPVPEPIDAPEPVGLDGASRLEVVDGGLVATLHVRAVEVPGWLTLQWYGPSLREAASDSVWLEAGGDPVHLRVAAPKSLDLVDGRWRLVVGFEGAVLRQLEAVVGEGGDPER